MTTSMSNKVFVDSGAFIALANEADQCHAAAKNCLQELSALKPQLFTSNFVLDETYTRIRRKAGLQSALAFGERVQSNRELKIVTVDARTEKWAWEVFKKYTDQPFSYTDCTSFALMQIKGISEAFTFDKDFRIFGFRVLPLLSPA